MRYVWFPKANAVVVSLKICSVCFGVMIKRHLFKICMFTVFVFAAVVVFDVPFAASKSPTSAWLTRCDKDDEGNFKHCEIYSRLNLPNTKKRVAEFAIGYSKESAGVARGVIVLPLGVFVQDDVVLSVDGKAYLNTKVSYCLESGCYAPISLPDQIITKMKKGDEAALTFKGRNGKPFLVRIPLTGFTKTIKEIRGI